MLLSTHAMRILFLGNNYSSLSIACLLTLVSAGRYSLLVALSDAIEGGVISTVYRLRRRYGLGGLLYKGRSLVLALVRRGARSVGIPSRGYRSLREIIDDVHLEQVQCASINAPETLEQIRSFKPDLIVSASYGQILRSGVLQIPSKGSINVHPSLLPRYRGPSPCYWAVKHREATTGVTVHFMNERIDAGDILLQEEVSIRPGESSRALERRLSPIGAELMLESIREVEKGTVESVKQDEGRASYFSFPKSSRHMGGTGSLSIGVVADCYDLLIAKHVNDFMF